MASLLVGLRPFLRGSIRQNPVAVSLSPIGGGRCGLHTGARRVSRREAVEPASFPHPLECTMERGGAAVAVASSGGRPVTWGRPRSGASLPNGVARDGPWEPWGSVRPQGRRLRLATQERREGNGLSTAPKSCSNERINREALSRLHDALADGPLLDLPASAGGFRCSCLCGGHATAPAFLGHFFHLHFSCFVSPLAVPITSRGRLGYDASVE